jgi:hypothetical protein
MLINENCIVNFKKCCISFTEYARKSNKLTAIIIAGGRLSSILTLEPPPPLILTARGSNAVHASLRAAIAACRDQCSRTRTRCRAAQCPRSRNIVAVN